MNMSTFATTNFKGKKALIRVDFNVPLNAAFQITDDTRMTAALLTIKKILHDGGSVILMSHLGRPKEGPTDKYSLKHLVAHLSSILGGTPVLFADDCIGKTASFSREFLLKMNERRDKGIKQILSYDPKVNRGAYLGYQFETSDGTEVNNED